MNVPIDYIKNYYFTRPYTDRNDDYVQVTISVDDFVQLEDNKYSNKVIFESDESVPNLNSIDYESAPLKLKGTKWNDFIDSLKEEQKVRLSRCWD